jgi:cytochrome P450
VFGGQEVQIGSAGRGLARRLHDAAEREGGIDPAAVTANAVGFLFQVHDAEAGLLGNAILALGARPDRRLLTFGHGRHACPGDAIAAAIAVAGLEALLDRLRDWPERAAGYRPSPNVRIPRFG